MSLSILLKQSPAPGSHIVMFRGDIITFSLLFPQKENGKAWLRTNIGHASAARRDIIREVHDNIPPLGREWFDVPMKRFDGQHFRVTLPLSEVGHFEAKCFFMKKGETRPVWPEGPNVAINVEPADTCCSNIIYNAFVRQFGPNKDGSYQPDTFEAECISRLDGKGYSVIPRSGTFRNLIRELDFIIGRLGCRIIHLLPVHPTPTTYGRMGRFGSPYAAQSFTGVDPALAEFDPKATPLEQFIELVDAVHERNAKIILDIAVNHTGWAAGLHETHPEWLVRDKEGEIKVPGAWGIQWEDLTSLDYSHTDLWRYIADVFLTWCRRGVDGFRCDAGYMIPVPAWKYIVAFVREQFPDTLFFLEGLGGKISVARDILNRANFNWAYSELFQNYDRGQVENYLPGAVAISQEDGIMVHFAETHDNPRLAARSETYAMMRTALCALSSHQGGFGFANGVEWFAKEKINVHEAPSLTWGAEKNQVEYIRRLNTILKLHPVFYDRVELKMIHKGNGNYIVLLRHHIPSGKELVIIVNLDDKIKTEASWEHQTDTNKAVYIDILTEKEIPVSISGNRHTCNIDPGQVLCLTTDKSDIDLMSYPVNHLMLPERIVLQKLKAKALEVFCFYNNSIDTGDLNPLLAAQQLKDNPVEFCRSCNPESEESRVVTWLWPRDLKREVMVPPGHFLLIRSAVSFRGLIIDKTGDSDQIMACEDSLPDTKGTFFTLFSPCSVPECHTRRALNLILYERDKCRHEEASLLFLTHPNNAIVKTLFRRSDLKDSSLIRLCTNGIGGMLRANVSWGRLNSKYDALLAANFNPDFPENRWIMFTRCRAWVVYQGFSQEISFDCFDTFYYKNNHGFWHYKIPTSQGESIELTIEIEIIHGENAMAMTFFRHPSKKQKGKLDDRAEVQLILRPDIEDRNFHDTTKAYLGPEHAWPKSVAAESNGFVFSPDPNRRLRIYISKGTFVREPEWYYMVHRPLEADRGLDAESDLYSPGYFSVFMAGSESVKLSAVINDSGKRVNSKLRKQNCLTSVETGPYSNASYDVKTDGLEPGDSIRAALSEYIVKRNDMKSVIAGYPWFLDWGRDSLIFSRGLIAAGRMEETRAVLRQFGRFEENGTLPNMILGNDAGNRDTSDAPLWFFIACSELVEAEKTDAFLDERCNDRSMRDILLSIGRSLIKGTPNGVYMDTESGLIFSPAHFTWMDTNYPACSPREGYCIEIQAMWQAALSFLSRIDASHKADWIKLSEKVKASISRLFLLKEGYLSDCLHAGPGTPAKKAVADDALRPNQLFAITLKAVTDKQACENILAACEELLVPGAIRSLADRPVKRPIEVRHNGRVINDPFHPYQGRYSGDEDTKRKPAYHNGTAWTWVFPVFCEAWAAVYGDKGKKAALAWLSSSTLLINHGCAGHIPEIVDGDFPHLQKGCDAQAWGASEFLRVWEKLI